MSAHTCCVRAVPYVNDIKEGQEKYFKMRLYIHASGNEIPEGVREAAEIKFKDYEIDYCDLQRRPLNRIVTQLPSSEKKREKELSELSKIIEENLHLFEKRLNVTAVQASYKVTDAKEKDELCVTVFVLEKGQIPAGETIFKGEMFGGYSSDIAEGYYLPAGSSSLESYVKPLHSGVGIGVKDEPGAGTLGGFLTDEEGKCYILSCEHVLHPGKKMDNPAIVQPAESDYEEIAAKARKELKPYSTITQKDLKEMGDDDFSERLSRFIQQKRDLIEKDKPRPIATYTCGVKKNIEVTFESRAVKVFVDAAIAELENSERDFMTKFSQDNPLYGCTSQYFENSPKGEIVKMADFETERKKEMSFMKVGRTTGLQDSGKIDKSSISAYINIIEAVDSPFCHFRCKHCENCGQTDSSEEEICKEDNDRLISCASCDKTFKSSDEVTSFWMRNCLAIRQRKEPFCDKGDSGALVFDSNGRAWGLVVGVFWDLSRDFLFCQVSPLSVTLKALESKSGKKLKFWCRE